MKLLRNTGTERVIDLVRPLPGGTCTDWKAPPSHGAHTQLCGPGWSELPLTLSAVADFSNQQLEARQ